MVRFMDGQMEGWIDGQKKNGQMDGWTNRKMDRWMDGVRDRDKNRVLFKTSSSSELHPCPAQL